MIPSEPISSGKPIYDVTADYDLPAPQGRKPIYVATATVEAAPTLNDTETAKRLGRQLISNNRFRLLLL